MAEQDPLGTIAACLATQPRPATDKTLAAIVHALEQRYGNTLQAVVLYGSYLLGKRDSLVDCTVVLAPQAKRVMGRWHWWLQQLLPPNVYYLPSAELGTNAHAKFATLTLPQLQQAITEHSHSYYWSRFAQPCEVLYSATDQDERVLTELRAKAIARCLAEAAALPDASRDPLERWKQLFRLTYAAELRAESPERANLLVDANANYYQALAAACTGRFEPLPQPNKNSYKLWRSRRWLGKTLSVLRLIKASMTFTDGLEYLLWKVERHSGVRLEASARQKQYPLLFAWPLIWRAYRSGGFR